LVKENDLSLSDLEKIKSKFKEDQEWWSRAVARKFF
jgi:hypothetical protein